MNAKEHLSGLVEGAGLKINGDRDFDLIIHDESVFGDVYSGGSIALGEAFMDKRWDVKRLDIALEKLFKSGASKQLRSPSAAYIALKQKVFNPQSKKRAFEVGQVHYDFGNELYERMLGPSMVYTCANFDNNSLDDLTGAQEAKLRQVCEKLDLKPGSRLLDIGCGWGALMKYAALNYGVSCVGVSVSEEQTKWARESFADLDCRIEIVDYRDFEDEEKFDYITSIEMIEAVGPKNFKTYFKKVRSLLKDDGKVLTQAINAPGNKTTSDPWIDKYIFPNGVFPHLTQLAAASEEFFLWEDVEDIGRNYEFTLDAWWKNLQSSYSKLQALNPELYTERTLRMFQYYLQSMKANAAGRFMQVHQILFTVNK